MYLDPSFRAFPLFSFPLFFFFFSENSCLYSEVLPALAPPEHSVVAYGINPTRANRVENQAVVYAAMLFILRSGARRRARRSVLH